MESSVVSQNHTRNKSSRALKFFTLSTAVFLLLITLGFGNIKLTELKNHNPLTIQTNPSSNSKIQAIMPDSAQPEATNQAILGTQASSSAEPKENSKSYQGIESSPSAQKRGPPETR